jgi:3-hydroxyacyl-CoA dehydrogenase
VSQEIQRALGTIEGKLDLLLESHKETRQDHEKRLSRLERHEKYTAGFAAALAFVGAKFWTLFK